MTRFFDCSFSQGSEGRYVNNTAESPLGMRFEESKDRAHTIIPQIDLGGSYTFLNGTAVYLEYLYYGPGYSKREAERYYDLLDATEPLFLAEEGHEGVKGFVLQQLSYASQKKMAFQRKNYVMLYATRTDWFEVIDITGGWVQNVDDRSFYVFSLIDYKINSSLKVFFNSLIYSTTHYGEFHAAYEYLQTVGVRFYF